MRLRWKFLLLFAFFVVLVGSYIYQSPWMMAYRRIQSAIRELPTSEQDRARREFDGQASSDVVAGLLVGNWFEKLVIFNSRGLHLVDTNGETIYSLFDGCQEETVALLRKGESDGLEIPRYVTADYREWKSLTQSGEYVLIYHPAKQDNGRMLAREVNYYNFWVFLPRGIERQCAK